MINISNLNKNFGKLKVIENLNLTVPEGEVIALVGPSGCGKTTLLHCITGIDNHFDGLIELENKHSREYLQENRIAMVFQQYSNFEWLTVKENIETPFFNGNISNNEKAEIVNKLLTDMGLMKFANSYMNELSGGMQQRVAVARALAQNTKIMALDEPFGALDIQNRNSLQNIFLNIKVKFNKTVIFITHDIEEAIFLADRVLVLSKIPATICAEFNTSFTLNNKNEIKYSSAFIEVKKCIESKFKEFSYEKIG